MNAYIRMLLHKLTLVTGKTDEEVTELAVLYLAAGLEPADTDKVWAETLQGVPKTTSMNETLQLLETAREFYLGEMGGEE